MQTDDRPEAWRGRVGLIIPAGNRLTEPQLARHAPPGLQFHTTRLRMTGAHRMPLAGLLEQVRGAAALLADAKVDLILFHCTANSMEHGPEGDARITEAIEASTGTRATTTASAIVAALRALALRRIVLLSPYDDETNAAEVRYLDAVGVEVLAAHGLALGSSDAYVGYPPSAWYAAALERRDPRADGYFLSCTNIRALEVLELLEAALDRPLVASNQAALWHCLRLLAIKAPVAGLGRLFAVPAPVA
jgi:maleate isomerase